MIPLIIHRPWHEPTPDQIAAGNYRKRKVAWNGLTVSIENEAGSVRRGKEPDGTPWETRMVFPYGYINRTEGVDGDHVDVFLGPDLDAPMVYVIHQRKVGRWDEYDEDKVMAGFDSEASAVQAFLANCDDPRFLGPVTAMPVAEFKAKVLAADGRMVKALDAVFRDRPDYFKPPARRTLFLKGNPMEKIDMLKSHIDAYTRSDGTVVRAHEDSRSAGHPDLGAHKVGDIVSYKGERVGTRTGKVKGVRDGKVVVERKAGYTELKHHSELSPAGTPKHKFIRANGEVVHADRFMDGPKLGPGKVWNRQGDHGAWVEEDSPHGPESDPNHLSHDLHLFGEHHKTFMQKQYR